MVVCHLHIYFGKSVRKVTNGTGMFSRPNRKFSGINGLFEKVVYVPTRKFQAVNAVPGILTNPGLLSRSRL